MIENDSRIPRAWTRRDLLLGAGTLALASTSAFANAPPGFDSWRESFRAKALAKGVSDATYTRVMGRIEPDMSVFAQMGNQPEFKEELWQYINRRVSDWRIRAGKEALRQHGALF
ncbi:lytic murein transglycosylase, partial [Afipia felis]|uniref:lytic murein transglycosylase n=1 Tax=Afipia felis TaxID=1035 RepID=UPI0006613E34